MLGSHVCMTTTLPTELSSQPIDDIWTQPKTRVQTTGQNSNNILFIAGDESAITFDTEKLKENIATEFTSKEIGSVKTRLEMVKIVSFT